MIVDWLRIGNMTGDRTVDSLLKMVHRCGPNECNIARSVIEQLLDTNLWVETKTPTIKNDVLVCYKRVKYF